jgi:hypothetical protein
MELHRTYVSSTSGGDQVLEDVYAYVRARSKDETTVTLNVVVVSFDRIVSQSVKTVKNAWPVHLGAMFGLMCNERVVFYADDMDPDVPACSPSDWDSAVANGTAPFQ